MHIVALDVCGERSGLKRGQGLAEARAMCPGIEIIQADPAADKALLISLADWCDRYTPLVALDGENGLYLDITGCVHLHGSEKALLSDVLSRLFGLGIAARGAISSSAGLSWAMARYRSGEIAAPQQAEAILSPLPLAALRLPLEAIQTLARVGLKTVGDIIVLPRAPLARRFGPSVLLRLDQALGFEDEPLSPRLPVASLSAERRLASPIQDEDDILELTLQLARSLKQRFEEREEGGRLFELVLFRVDGKVFRIRAATSAVSKDPERISALYRERLQAIHDDLDVGYGFEILRLCVLKTERYAVVQEDFSGKSDPARSLSAFADRVLARFGPESLSVLVLQESHVPERATNFMPVSDIARPAVAEKPDLPVLASPPSTRPLRLFRHPERVDAIAAELPEGAPASFKWRRTTYQVARAEGPERIAGEWWIDGEDALTRDYFRVEDADGRRFWLFRDGLYSQVVISPQWFMHGIFA
ncbi:MAG TPA: DNA polymerase Y family protein [Pararhizobium sp.]|uniref:Y-family DNA polymerase n=1 Tax=Pararhizobium sp. TaxID=1977563 RepID=UPI002C795ACC|nr:DNA polymerase Y family protein [Pararhizobium sp.]HTO32399.1 DNA polymerase Y family protein [Pararhizobium sp.]